MKTWMLAIAAVAISAANGGEVVKLGTRVTGNQEQPRVLYIVPWQTADGPDSLYKNQDFSSQKAHLLEPLERASFQRELLLRQQFEPVSAGKARP